MMHPLHASPDMLEFARRAVGEGDTLERARRLYKAILDYGLEVGYCEDLSRERRPDGCRTAHQVFAEAGVDGKRFAMCIEYTLLFLALAPAAGLKAVPMRKRESIGEGQGFVFGHVAVGVETEAGLKLLDLAQRRFWRETDGFDPISVDKLLGYCHNNTGIIFTLQGRSEEAEAAFTRALQEDAGTATFWFNRGSLQLRRGLASDARKDLSRAAGLEPESVQVLTNLAVAETALGERRQAREILYLARTLAPEDARVAFNLGVLAYEDDDLVEAEKHWREAVAVDPAYQQARRWLSTLLRNTGRKEEGFRVLGGLA
jgi:tetratricopeptide (TPR) repeat protein